MSDLSNVLTPEQRTRENGCCVQVLAICVSAFSGCLFVAVCGLYPIVGKIIASLFVLAACVLIGFDVGRRFDRRVC